MIKTTITAILTLLLISNDSLGQTSDPYHKVFTQAEKEPEFPGGDSAWLLYIVKNLKMEVAEDFFRKEKIKTQIVDLEFLIDTNGKVSQIKVINKKEVGSKVAKETIRVIEEGPDWLPAVQNKIKVVFLKKLSVTWVAPQD